MAQSALSGWYGSLRARLVDLVGDFAGSDLFIIEGDSLLLRCFSDSRLDFHDGFQLLHAVYIVEKFLEKLLDRRCIFHIVFFERHKNLCIPQKALQKNEFKYHLAREVIIRHLETNFKDTNFEVKIFSNPTSSEFSRYLTDSDVHFFLLHSGEKSEVVATLPDDETNGQSENVTNQDKYRLYKATIRYFLLRGYDVALIGDLEFRDTRIMAHVIEGGRIAHSSTPEIKDEAEILLAAPAPNSPANGSSSTAEEHEFVNSILKAKGSDTVSQRAVLSCLALKNIASGQGSGHPDCIKLVSATLLQTILLEQLPIQSRSFKRINIASSPYCQEFLQEYCDQITHCLEKFTFDAEKSRCDVADIIDGQLLAICVANYHDIVASLPSRPKTQLESLASIVGLSTKSTHDDTGNGSALSKELSKLDIGKSPTSKSKVRNLELFAFSNAVFDKHLSSVQVNARNLPPGMGNKGFKDNTHWHNRKPLVHRVVPITDFRALRRNQRYMRDMIVYAASLTNASGRVLKPETVIVLQQTVRTQKALQEKSAKPATKPAVQPAKSSKKQVVTSKERTIQAAKDAKETKIDAAGKSSLDAWKKKREQLENESSLDARFSAASHYLNSLEAMKLELLSNETRLYLVQILMLMWANACKQKNKSEHMGTLAVLLSNLTPIQKSGRTTIAEAKACSDIVKALGFPLSFSATEEKRKLSFSVAIPPSLEPLPMDFAKFILMHYGPYMDRDMDSQFDERVPFEPDGWQRKVLDEIDANRSVFVVAPTSSGKTFISFYAMKQILSKSDDGILVYLAPTKALVAQVSAEIQARFSKKYPHAGQSIWAMHTRDYRVNNPDKCQILVTVPHVLQIMLMAPENAKLWAPRVRRIIFDEIHTIGQAEDGLVWEQLLMLAPCPIIALSATVGNADEFSDWMASTQSAMGFKLTKIEHLHRWSDLRKFKYIPPKKFYFEGLRKMIAPIKMSIDNDPAFGFVHPIASLSGRGTIPTDLALEARDCLTLWGAMKEHETERYTVPEALSPGNALPSSPAIPKKADIIKWEVELKALLWTWMSGDDSPFENILGTLGRTMSSASPEKLAVGPADIDVTKIDNAKFKDIDSSDLASTTLPLLCSLQVQNALPAVVFNFDRQKCDYLCQTVLEQLVKAEGKFKAVDPAFKSRVQGWEKWKESKAKKVAKAPKVTATKKKTRGGSDDEDGDEGMSRMDSVRDSGSLDPSGYEGWDPSDPLDAFSFANPLKATRSEIEDYINKLKWSDLDPWFINALKRGLAVHHSGTNRKYRQSVEMLFRKGFLRVVIATGTLALGVNMPAKTSVFSGDSVFLTALNFRQAAGRAGRRGFDLLGNVVFQNIEDNKIRRLLSSKLPDLIGHFPHTPSLILRLCSLLHNSEEAEYSRKAVDSLLSQPRIYLGGRSFQHQVLHHFRFSIEYLRRQNLLSPVGAPLSTAGIVQHLYYTEHPAFAFHALLIGGFFNETCKDFVKTKNKVKVLEMLMLVLANLFGRTPIRPSRVEKMKAAAKTSPSMLILPPLPQRAREMLKVHDEETKAVFEQYVETYINQHLSSPEFSLPLSRLPFSNSPETLTGIPSKPPVKIRSPFVALSSHDDSFPTIEDLCDTVRCEVFLEKTAIPKLGPDNEVLNAWLYDFWMHQDLRAIEEDNGVRKSEIWFALNDFSLILKTIITSLTCFIKEEPLSALDFLDIQGDGDKTLESKEDVAEPQDAAAAAAAAGQEKHQQDLQAQARAQAQAAEPAGNKKKQKLKESWDDSEDDDTPAVKKKDGEVEESWDASGSDSGGSDGEAEMSAAASEASAVKEMGDLKPVLQALKLLQADFMEKFIAMWA